MRLLLDECVPARLRRALTSHRVSTVVEEGWSGIKNGELLALAAVSFDALVTVDKNLPVPAEHIDSSGRSLGAGRDVERVALLATVGSRAGGGFGKPRTKQLRSAAS